MSAEDNKKLVCQVIEEFNKGNYHAFREAMDPDCKITFWTGETMNRQELDGFMGELVRAFPDSKLVVDDIIAEDHKVVTRFTERGTMKEGFEGMEPTGKYYSLPSIEIYHIHNGKIVRMWAGIWLTRDLEAVFQTRLGRVHPSEQAA